MRICLNNLTRLPATAVEEIFRHVKVVEVYKNLNTNLLSNCKKVVIVFLALWIKVAVNVQQAAPLDRSANGIQAKRLEKLKIVFHSFCKVISGIGTNAIVECVDVQVRPGVPKVWQLSTVLPFALGLWTRHCPTKEKILRQLIRHVYPFSNVLNLTCQLYKTDMLGFLCSILMQIR